jgi:hypothetical protein
MLDKVRSVSCCIARKPLTSSGFVQYSCEGGEIRKTRAY